MQEMISSAEKKDKEREKTIEKLSNMVIAIEARDNEREATASYLREKLYLLDFTATCKDALMFIGEKSVGGRTKKESRLRYDERRINAGHDTWTGFATNHAPLPYPQHRQAHLWLHSHYQVFTKQRDPIAHSSLTDDELGNFFVWLKNHRLPALAATIAVAQNTLQQRGQVTGRVKTAKEVELEELLEGKQALDDLVKIESVFRNLCRHVSSHTQHARRRSV